MTTVAIHSARNFTRCTGPCWFRQHHRQWRRAHRPWVARLFVPGRVATEGALKQLERLRQERDRVTVTIARRELRRWLRESSEGQAVEDVVSALLYMQVIQTEIVSAAYAIGGRSAAHV